MLVTWRSISGFTSSGRLAAPRSGFHEAELDSLALRLTSWPSQAPTGRLPAPPLSQLHGERAISMVSTFQLTRSTRLTLTHPTEANFEAQVSSVQAVMFVPTEPNRPEACPAEPTELDAEAPVERGRAGRRARCHAAVRTASSCQNRRRTSAPNFGTLRATRVRDSPTIPTWWPPLPPTSEPSWVDCGWMPRPTNTRPRRNCWGHSRSKRRWLLATPCSHTARCARRRRLRPCRQGQSPAALGGHCGRLRRA